MSCYYLVWNTCRYLFSNSSSNSRSAVRLTLFPSQLCIQQTLTNATNKKHMVHISWTFFHIHVGMSTIKRKVLSDQSPIMYHEKSMLHNFFSMNHIAVFQKIWKLPILFFFQPLLVNFLFDLFLLLPSCCRPLSLLSLARIETQITLPSFVFIRRDSRTSEDHLHFIQGHLLRMHPHSAG